LIFEVVCNPCREIQPTGRLVNKKDDLNWITHQKAVSRIVGCRAGNWQDLPGVCDHFIRSTQFASVNAPLKRNPTGAVRDLDLRDPLAAARRHRPATAQRLRYTSSASRVASESA
jgi:hypothetical protein